MSNNRRLGCGVYFNGNMVAWFSEFNQDAQEWCSEYYFGEWLTWPCYEPARYVLTEEESLAAAKRAQELADLFNTEEDVNSGHRTMVLDDGLLQK